MCKQCGANLTPATDARGRARNFCDKRCIALWREAGKRAAAPPVEQETTTCACGCGTVIPTRAFWREQRYAHGHNSRARHDTRTCKLPGCGTAYPARRRGGDYCSRACSSASRINDHRIVRSGAAYRRWRTAVLTRDGNACRGCGFSGPRLHAHHVNEFAAHPDLRLVVDNGITLCASCHSWVHGRRLDASVNLENHVPHLLTPELASRLCGLGSADK